MKSIYDPNLVAAATETLHNGAFTLLITDYMANLKVSVMDAVEPNEILKAHNEHASIVAFAEYIQMLGDDPLTKKEPKDYG